MFISRVFRHSYYANDLTRILFVISESRDLNYTLFPSLSLSLSFSYPNFVEKCVHFYLIGIVLLWGQRCLANRYISF